MSFYQPSLSLYDVLDALSNKAGAREDRYEPGNIYAQRLPQRRNTLKSDHRRGGNLFPRRQAYVPEGYYYSVPNSSYYQPAYYSSEEQQQPQRRPQVQPVHRHVAPQSRSNIDLVQALLGALASDSTSDPYFGQDEEEDEEEYEGNENFSDNGENETASGSPDGLAGSAENEEGDTDAEGQKKSVEKPTEDSTDECNQDYNMDNRSGLETAPLEQTKEEPRKRSKVSSFQHAEASSPIPAPLQVSNPEMRLDLPFSPEVNVYDTPEQYIVVLALPGANSKEFKIDYHPSSHELLIKGTVENKLGIDEKFTKISELKYGAFERSVKFPVLPRIKDEEIKASYFNGLLQIKVPKMPQDSTPKPKKVILIEDVPDEELVFEQTHNTTL